MSTAGTLKARIRLIRTLRRHIKLSEKRNPIWEQNKASKYIIWFMMCFSFLYMMFIAVMLSLIANEAESMTSYEFLYSFTPFILIIDFLFRFMAQRTPSQLIKPYVLLPVPRYACIDSFIVSSLISSGNLTWFVIFAPYALMSVVFSYGIGCTIGFMLGFYLLILADSQWYMLIRSLVKQSMLWWLLPAVVYAALLSPWYAFGKPDFERLIDFYSAVGDGLTTFSPIPYLIILAVFITLVAINRRTQYHFIWSELAADNKSKTLRSVSELKLFDKWGETGEYLKLEIKSLMRNKNIRTAFISATALDILFSLVLSFTDIYDSFTMTNFWCIYCFALFGAMILIKIMCYEGNYIDGLMVRKENILSLLKAKYIIYSTLLILPFMLLLPTVFTGKCTLLMLIAYALLTAGPIYCIYFQMAVYNKQTVPLNTKFIGKGSTENNYIQILANVAVFGLPITAVSCMEILLGETVTHIIIMTIGLLFIITCNIWMRNIYNRMMKRKYTNLDSFRATR